MRIDELQADDAVLIELGRRLARHRLNLNWTQARLAQDAGVSRDTVQRLEAGDGVALTSFVRVLQALELLGGLESAIPDPLPTPIQLLDLEGEATQAGIDVEAYEEC